MHPTKSHVISLDVTYSSSPTWRRSVTSDPNHLTHEYREWPLSVALPPQEFTVISCFQQAL